MDLFSQTFSKPRGPNSHCGRKCNYGVDIDFWILKLSLKLCLKPQNKHGFQNLVCETALPDVRVCVCVFLRQLKR